MDFKVEMNERGEGVFVASLEGSLNADTVFSFEQKVLPVLVGTVKVMILEMSGLRYIDSTALAAVMRQRRTVEESGGRLFVTGLRPRLRDIFQVIHILPDECIFNTVDEVTGRLDAK